MNGVDIADQLRKYYSTQITVRRTWFPLFFWLLDTVIINSYLAYKRKDPINNKMSHKEFRLDIIWSLLEDALIESNRLKKSTRSDDNQRFYSTSIAATRGPYITPRSQLS